jgi:FkbM family methyltransferase
MIFEKDKYIKFLEFFATNRSETSSQLSQDLFVIYFTGGKKDGFFLEIGACNGFKLSNSLVLEKHGWKGIVSEPNPIWHNKLINRKCIISKKAVFSKSGLKLKFKSVEKYPELSGLEQYLEKDNNYEFRNNANTNEVETISLNDLIEENASENNIDYISIDTEGSEYEILKNFNFKKYNVEIITVEHNFVEKKRDLIFDLITSHNYIRVFTNISRWDDWYIKKNNKILLSMMDN